jgi:hypothetical protein
VKVKVSDSMHFVVTCIFHVEKITIFTLTQEGGISMSRPLYAFEVLLT